MCFGGDDPPAAPNNAPTYSTDQAQAGAAAAEIAKDPTVDDTTKVPPASMADTTAKSKASGAAYTNLRM